MPPEPDCACRFLERGAERGGPGQDHQGVVFVVAFNHMVATKAELCCVAKAMDRYIQLELEDTIGKGKIDPRLQKIIEGIFQSCIEEGEYKQVSIFHSLYC